MDSKEYYFYNLFNLLEDKLPPKLFLEVKNYLNIETIEKEEKLTQAQRVLNHLMKYGSITNMQCHLLYGIRHCPAVIRDVKKKLKRNGDKLEIQTENKKGCDRYGNKTIWKSYILKEAS